MSLPSITPADAKVLIDRGALLIDIRDHDEFARERISQATNTPLPGLGSVGKDRPAVVFHCKSGNRTRMNAARLAEVCETEAFILEGGLEGWKKAGLPVTRDTKRPIEMMRQVQIAAGGMTLVGAILGYTIDPGFHALSGAVGAGLLVSGATGSCAMAHLLKLMPWNRMAA